MFVCFFQILIFWVVSRVKGQKMAQNDKKSCSLCSIFQDPYILWLLVMVRMFKMIIAPCFFFFFFFHFFKILIAWVVSEVIWQKMPPNDKKFCPLRSISQELYIIWLSFVVHIFKMIFPVIFFIFSKFEFLGC